MGTGAGRRSALTVFVLVVVLLGVVSAAPAAGPEAAARYLDFAIALLRENALDRGKVDWPVVETQAHRMAGRARTTADTYPATRYVIQALGNPHTMLLTPEEARAGDASSIVLPTAGMVDHDIAMLTIPGLLSPDPADARRYVEAGMTAVRAVSDSARCGWIVDLRHNGGGNMWPMVTVLAPLLGNGTIGHFVSADGRRTTWSLSEGRAAGRHRHGRRGEPADADPSGPTGGSPYLGRHGKRRRSGPRRVPWSEPR
ncbi:S41 family peptidase [Amycolatopsis pigmentata]|uniref:S41 family peptidase n=1 Tax=Amycolatopsis pigmentata TaxID=450801 RepID=A0ABW5FXP0_9PSEU